MNPSFLSILLNRVTIDCHVERHRKENIRSGERIRMVFEGKNLCFGYSTKKFLTHEQKCIVNKNFFYSLIFGNYAIVICAFLVQLIQIPVRIFACKKIFVAYCNKQGQKLTKNPKLIVIQEKLDNLRIVIELSSIFPLLVEL